MRANGFAQLDTFGQWASYIYPYRYCIYDSSEKALIQAWPSDRPGAWFLAVLNFYSGKLDYGVNPRPPEGIVEVANRYLTSSGVRCWVKNDRSFFTSHPWSKTKAWGTQASDDIGVPGTMQFLTEYPFCESSGLEGNDSPIGIGVTQRLILAPVVSIPNEYDEENMHTRKLDI